MNTRLPFALAAVAATLLLSACATAPQAPKTLRVGYSPIYPPVIFSNHAGQPMGVEADFADALADALHTQAEPIAYEWSQLIPALQDGEIDIIMSGMTITPGRATQVLFCDPYMDNPLIALARAGEAASFPTAESILNAPISIGALRGTSGEIFARRNCHSAKIVPVALRGDVPLHLASHRYKLYIDDLAAIVDIVRQSEATLDPILIPLREQKLAWAVAADNAALRDAANAALASWRNDGRLNTILHHWLLYRNATLESASAPAVDQ